MAHVVTLREGAVVDVPKGMMGPAGNDANARLSAAAARVVKVRFPKKGEAVVVLHIGAGADASLARVYVGCNSIPFLFEKYLIPRFESDKPTVALAISKLAEHCDKGAVPILYIRPSEHSPDGNNNIQTLGLDRKFFNNRRGLVVARRVRLIEALVLTIVRPAD